MQKRTVRELGGEIWAELSNEVEKSRGRGNALDSLDFKTINATIDLIMAVLARHPDTVIVNNSDLPVIPRPYSSPKLSE